MRAWALELGCAEDGYAKEEEGVGEKRGNPYLFIKEAEVMRLPTCPKRLLIPQALY